MLTKVDVNGEGFSVGFVSKHKFARKKLVAGPEHDLDEGTWYLHKDDLHTMPDFYRKYAWRGGVDDGQHLETYCETCGKPASFGFGVALLKGRLGTWFCNDHKQTGAAR